MGGRGRKRSPVVTARKELRPFNGKDCRGQASHALCPDCALSIAATMLSRTCCRIIMDGVLEFLLGTGLVQGRWRSQKQRQPLALQTWRPSHQTALPCVLLQSRLLPLTFGSSGRVKCTSPYSLWRAGASGARLKGSDEGNANPQLPLPESGLHWKAECNRNNEAD